MAINLRASSFNMAFLSPASLILQTKYINRLRCNRIKYLCTSAPISQTEDFFKSSTISSSPLQQLRHSGNFLRTHWQFAFHQTMLDSPCAIDATAGRGSDTISLGKLAGSNGIVHALDIQAAALEETKTRYEKSGSLATLHLHQKSHDDFSFLQLETSSVVCITYNLGWYPGKNADRNIITKSESTILSLKCAESLIAPGGLISIVAYVGHEHGEDEKEAVCKWAKSLDKRQWVVGCFSYPNRIGAPVIILAERLK